jgi:drug/metabolite transporter (DMT)-like permease
MRMALNTRAQAIASILAAIALANIQDAIVKGFSSIVPAYEVLIFRTVFAFPFLFGWLLWRSSFANMFKGPVLELALRSVILFTAYFAFILALAALPMATAISIYFTMPFFVAGLSGLVLREKVSWQRWLAIAIGFIGVLISVRPQTTGFQLSFVFGLYSAFAYAVAQMWGRRLTAVVDSPVILNWQNFTNFAFALLLGIVVTITPVSELADPSLDFLLRPWVWPTTTQFILLVGVGITASAVAAFFLNAYRLAEASFVAPFEYSAIVWATLYGVLFFNEFPDRYTILGAVIVIGAGLFMLSMERRRELNSEQ